MAEQADESDAGWGEGLAMLRLVAGVRQGPLAAALGVADSTLSGYELGVRPAPKPLLRQAVATLGFPPYLLDEARSLGLWAKEARRLPGEPAAAARARAELTAREAGIAMESLVRQALAAVLREGLAAAPDVPLGGRARRSADAPAGDARQLDRLPTRSAGQAAVAATLGESTDEAAGGPSRDRPRRAGRPARQRGGPLPKTLRILRTLVCGLDRHQLAAASGVSADSVKGYELDLQSPSPASLDRLLEGMGLSAVVLDRVSAFVEAANAKRGARGGGPPSLDAHIAALAAAEAHRAASARRALLERLGPAAVLLDSRRRAPALWARLARYPHAVRRALVREVAEFQQAGLCELLCEESVRAAADSARQALRLARLAVLASERVPAARGGGPRLTGFCRAHLANALRVAGRLAAADRESSRAGEFWQAGAATDPGLLNEARVLHMEASLRRDQQQIPEALALLDRALAIDRWGATPSLLIAKSYALWAVDQFEASIAILHQAASLIDPEAGMRNFFLVRLNVAFNLCELGHYAAARLALPEVRALARRLGNRLDSLRVAWLQAKVAVGMGEVEQAAAGFARVCIGFERQKISYDAALVALELAELHATLGRTGAVKALARKAAPIFQAQGVHREARRALELFRRAAEQERATVQLIRSVASYLQKARRDRTLRYQEAA